MRGDRSFKGRLAEMAVRARAPRGRMRRPKRSIVLFHIKIVTAACNELMLVKVAATLKEECCRQGHFLN